MLPVNFKANFIPNIGQFRIELTTPDDHWIHIMPPTEFITWVKKRELSIGDLNVKFHSVAPEVESQIWDYFETVAKSYQSHYEGGKSKNNVG